MNFVYIAILLTACSALVPTVDRATCVFQRGGDVSGHVSFSRRGLLTTTTVTYNLKGLTPGIHKWHVHMYGDVAQDTSMGSTGGHFVGDPPPGRSEIANFATAGASITAETDG